jgi:uncharacterized protein (DUF1697 family)
VPIHVALLRGINLGSRNRISMPELRDALAAEGFEDVRTYLQSGNVVLASDAPPEKVARRLERLISQRFGLDVAVVARTRKELAEVVRRNPFADAATDPKRYQVSFLEEKPARGLSKTLEEIASDDEQVRIIGREIYAWHPRTIARSKLWALLAGPKVGTRATARNWTTVTKLLELADELDGSTSRG